MSWAYEPNVTKYSFSPDSANALLDQAGWKRAADGKRGKDGKPLALTLITQAGFTIRENVAQAIQRQLADVGVTMQIKLLDGTAISPVWFSGDFDAMLHWWQSGADPEITTFFAADKTPPAGRNIDYLNDAALTKVLYASDREIDQAKRGALLKDAQRRVSDLIPEIFLYNTSKLDAVPVTLQNFKGNPSNAGPFWNVHEWEIRQSR